MKSPRVAFVGPAGVGKTTHAMALWGHYGGEVLSFATPMKNILRELFGDKMDDKAFYRKACQKFGTDFARELDPQVWVRQLTKRVGNLPTFVDDCRFQNEYEALRELGFTFIRLTASPETLAQRRPEMTGAAGQHASELDQAGFEVDEEYVTDLFPVELTSLAIRGYLDATRQVAA